MAKIEYRQGPLRGFRVEFGGFLDRFLYFRNISLQRLVLGLKRLFLDNPAQITVQKTVLHIPQLRFPFGKHGRVPPVQLVDIGEGGLQRVPKPVGYVLGGHTQRRKVFNYRLFQLFFPPANLWVIFVRVIIRAPIVQMLAHAAALELAPNKLAGYGGPAIRTPDDATRKQVAVNRYPAVTAIQYVLAEVKGLMADDCLKFARIAFAVADDFPNVEPVVQDIGNSRPVKARLALPENKSLGRHVVLNTFEGVLPCRVQLEEPHNCL